MRGTSKRLIVRTPISILDYSYITDSLGFFNYLRDSKAGIDEFFYYLFRAIPEPVSLDLDAASGNVSGRLTTAATS
jgi:hypothetical protein